MELDLADKQPVEYSEEHETALAPTTALTVARGHNKRPVLTAWQRQVRAVVTLGLLTRPARVLAHSRRSSA